MRKVFLALAFAAIIVSSMMLPADKIRTVSTFNSLKNSKTGQSILTAIQLELSSNASQENIVDNILSLLDKLLRQSESSLTQTQTDLTVKTGECDSTRSGYENQIEGKKTQINSGEIELPNLRLEKTSDEANLATEEDKHTQAKSDLSDAEDANNKSLAAFLKSTQNHNNMIEALQKARALIASLKTASFIQNSTNQILAQLTAHTSVSVSALASHQNRDIFQVLMQMAQEVATQSDQELVGHVLEIIDDLLQSEAEALEQEAENEESRKTDHETKVGMIDLKITTAANEVLRLESEITRLGNDIKSLEDNLVEWNSQLTNLEDTLVAHNSLCTQEIQDLNDDIAEYTSEIDVIRQVIDIFNSNAIQDIKPVVANMEG